MRLFSYLTAIVLCSLPALGSEAQLASRDVFLGGSVGHAWRGDAYTPTRSFEHLGGTTYRFQGAYYPKDGWGVGALLTGNPRERTTDVSATFNLRAPIRPRLNLHVYGHAGPRLILSQPGIQGGVGFGLSMPVMQNLNVRADWTGRVYRMFGGDLSGHRAYGGLGIELAL